MKRKMHFWKFFSEALFIFLMTCLHSVLSTEISEASPTKYEYLGLTIKLPVLLCHPKKNGYKEVIWKKDYTVVKTGTADLKSHMLSIESLLDENSDTFDSPFELQGYYRCETDVSAPEHVHDYLFRIEDIYTYVGKLVAKKDYLGNDNTLSFKNKLIWKKQIYEDEMHYLFFKGLPFTNISVTDIKVLEKGGLEVHFYLYVRDPINGRKATDNELKTDEEHLLDIKDYLQNVTTSTDGYVLKHSEDWIDLLGIEYEDIDIKSTLGCYRESYTMSINTTEEVNWPYARIGHVAIPDNACLTKNGLAVTRMCTGSFTIGATWGTPSGNCDRPPTAITQKLKNIFDNYGRYRTESKIENLTELTSYTNSLGVSDLHIVAEILDQLSETSKLTIEDIKGIFSVIDHVLDTNKTELVAAKKIIRLTSRFLRIINNILKMSNDEGKKIKVVKPNLSVCTKTTEAITPQNLVVGLAVAAPDNPHATPGGVEFLRSSDKLPVEGSMAYFTIPEKLVLERISNLEIPCKVNMVFFQNWNLFQSPKDVLPKRNYRVLPSPVMYVSISGGPAWNLTDPVQLYYKDVFDIEIEDPVCVYYDARLDDGAGAWSSEGCEYKGLKEGFYHCSCHHLSIFSIALSQSPYSLMKMYNLGTAVYVACGVSIIALTLVVLLFILSKSWRKTVDHSILFCLSLTFLASVMTIFVSEAKFERKPGCIVLAMFFHYFIFATFGWLMVQAVIYRLRFAKKTDVSEIPHFMIKAALTVWGAPIIIIVIIWFTKDFSYPVKEGCWLTVYEVARVSSIPVLILINVTLCINLCATYSLTCRFRKDFMIGDTQYNDVAVKFRVAFTIFSFFVLSWLFGFLSLQYKSQTLRILFSIAITLTAYYVCLFFIFQEVSFWDLCTCCKQGKNKEPEAPVLQYPAKSYRTTEETNVKQ